MRGKNGPKGKTTRKPVTVCFDSFLTIWLLTLPEKFKEWYDFHHPKKSHNDYIRPIKFDLWPEPKFPVLEKGKDTTKLDLHKKSAKLY